MRGEYSDAASMPILTWELPPRARRIPRWYFNAHDFHVNYLRVRGEYEVFQHRATDGEELPPRARRIRDLCHTQRDQGGTTSACAENTIFWYNSTTRSRNYLRVRGEYPHPHANNRHEKELPPRARRIQHFWREELIAHGTTSACAENTGCGRRTCTSQRNYLRVRGEY